MSIRHEILDNHIAGVSANRLFTLHAPVCEYLTDITPLFSADTASKRTAMENYLHGEGIF